MDLLELMANLCSKTGLAPPSNKVCLWIHSGTELIEKELSTTEKTGLLTILRATGETHQVPRGVVIFFFSPRQVPEC